MWANLWPIVGGEAARGMKDCNEAGIIGAKPGKNYYAVISKGTPGASVQGSPEAQFAGTKEKAG